ncbi:MAG: hypothetical protein HQM08_26180 [Candidatus Riflebacteria bacterium]|nr:hypothetical protein [Candidatus Riflebacteria bacterium]
METFELIKKCGLEQLIFFHEKSLDLKAVVVIQNTVLGPAVGGVRVMEYPDEQSMLDDAMDLASEMTLRAALADCDLGGGSAVLWSDGKKKGEAYFRAFGRFINRLAGGFLAVMEMGTDNSDLNNIKRETDFIYALPVPYGGIADPTEITAEGLMHGIKATAKAVFGNSNLENMTCLVQGVGRLGGCLVNLLSQAKAKIIITDKNYDKIKNIQDKYPDIKMAQPNEAIYQKCDIAIPCAFGNFVTQNTVENIKCRIIAGGASNIIPDVETGDLLHKKGIIYTPHFVIDSGELIQADYELKKRSVELLKAAVAEIYGRTLAILETAKEQKEAPIRTALRMGSERLTNIGNIGRRSV